MGRICTAFLMLAAAGLTFFLDNAQQAFGLILSIGAGTGLIYLLRWFWWRINAWCEIAAMTASFVVAIGFFIAGKNGVVIPAHVSLLWTIAATTVVWVSAAFLTPATDRATLVAFYRKVRPAGPGWNSVRAEAGVATSPDSLPPAFIAWSVRFCSRCTVRCSALARCSTGGPASLSSGWWSGQLARSG